MARKLDNPPAVRTVVVEIPPGVRTAYKVASSGAGVTELIDRLRADLRGMCRTGACTSLIVTVHALDPDCSHEVP